MTEQNSNEIFGIDLGTTYSCIAIWMNMAPEAVPNTEGARTTPSVIFLTEKTGWWAMRRRTTPVCTRQVVEMVKRQMGHSDWCFFYNETEYTPEEYPPIFCEKWWGCGAILNCEIKDVVITCPPILESTSGKLRQKQVQLRAECP